MMDVLIRWCEDRHTDTHVMTEAETSDAVVSQGPPRLDGPHQRLAEGFPPESQRECGPAGTWILNF